MLIRLSDPPKLQPFIQFFISISHVHRENILYKSDEDIAAFVATELFQPVYTDTYNDDDDFKVPTQPVHMNTDQ